MLISGLSAVLHLLVRARRRTLNAGHMTGSLDMLFSIARRAVASNISVNHAIVFCGESIIVAAKKSVLLCNMSGHPSATPDAIV